jgi:hypothetical protein
MRGRTLLSALSFTIYENQAAKPIDLDVISRCSFGAISVEKMDFMDSMDARELTPSREKTEITPLNAIYSHPIGFEVSRSIH